MELNQNSEVVSIAYSVVGGVTLGIFSLASALSEFPHALQQLNLSHCSLSGKRAVMLVRECAAKEWDNIS